MSDRIEELERERDKLQRQLTRATEQIAQLQTGRIRDAVRLAAAGSSMRAEALDDIAARAERIFEIGPAGDVQTRDGVGVTPGISPEMWLGEMLPNNLHWRAEGGDPKVSGHKNPFSKEHWNLTEQGRFYQQYGEERTRQMAEAAGSRIGATAPKG